MTDSDCQYMQGDVLTAEGRKTIQCDVIKEIKRHLDNNRRPRAFFKFNDLLQTGASVDFDITNSALIWQKSLILLLAFIKVFHLRLWTYTCTAVWLKG